MPEIWLPVVGAEGEYEVSNLGRVRSLARLIQNPGSRRCKPFVRSVPARVLKPGRATAGHLTVVVSRARGSKCVHDLVMRAFVGPPPPGNEVRHLDGNPGNNVLSNLEYGTRSQNSQDKKWHNGQGNYKLSPEMVREIKASGAPGILLAKMYQVTPSIISAIRHGKIHTDVQ